MANPTAPRSGRGVTTSRSMMGRGPRCQKCAEFVSATWRDPNGLYVCVNCGGARLNDGLITVVDGLGDPFVDEDDEV